MVAGLIAAMTKQQLKDANEKAVAIVFGTAFVILMTKIGFFGFIWELLR